MLFPKPPKGSLKTQNPFAITPNGFFCVLNCLEHHNRPSPFRFQAAYFRRINPKRILAYYPNRILAYRQNPILADKIAAYDS